MGDILHLRDEHEQVQMLLPWRANGTLEAGELAMVDAHLDRCDECRAELADTASLRAAYASLPVEDVPTSTIRPKAIPSSSNVRFLRRRITLGRALAAQAAVAAAAVAIFFAVQPAEPQRGEYRLLAAAPSRGAGNAIVLFSPDSSARHLRATLDNSAAQIVEGPTASGAFVIRIDPAQRSAALAKLRAAGGVVLAEPIDAPTGQ